MAVTSRLTSFAHRHFPAGGTLVSPWHIDCCRCTRGQHLACGHPEKNWPVFRGDVLASGIAHTKVPDNLEQLWKMEVANGAFEATPVVVDGIVYIGDLDGKLFALDLKDGKEKWNWKIDSGFMASPAVRRWLDLSRRYQQHMCHCIDASTGKEKWKFTAEAEVDSSTNFWQDKVLFGSQDRHLYCLEAKTGTLVWKHAIEDQIRCTPTVVGDRCFVAGCDSKLHIIDLKKGTEETNVPIDGPTGVTPAVFGDHVFFGTEGGTIFSVDWKQGKVAWQEANQGGGQPYRSAPAVMEGLMIVGSRAQGLKCWHLIPLTAMKSGALLRNNASTAPPSSLANA